MEIQKVFCSYGVQSRYNCPGGKCEPKIYLNSEEPVDEFVPSFGAKSIGKAKKLIPLVIPEEMYTGKEAKEFSKLVEAMRSINDRNYTQKKYRDAAKILLDENDCFNKYAQILDFLEANAPEIKNGEKNFDDVFDLFVKALETPKKDPATTFVASAAENFEKYGYFENNPYNFVKNNIC